MNKLAMYLRLSIEDYQKESESESIHNQREYIKGYIKEHNDLTGYEVSEYVDMYNQRLIQYPAHGSVEKCLK